MKRIAISAIDKELLPQRALSNEIQFPVDVDFLHESVSTNRNNSSRFKTANTGSSAHFATSPFAALSANLAELGPAKTAGILADIGPVLLTSACVEQSPARAR